MANKTSLLTVTSNGHLLNVHERLAIGKQECFLFRNQTTSGPGEENSACLYPQNFLKQKDVDVIDMKNYILTLHVCCET